MDTLQKQIEAAVEAFREIFPISIDYPPPPHQGETGVLTEIEIGARTNRAKARNKAIERFLHYALQDIAEVTARAGVVEKCDEKESYDVGSEHATPRNYRADGFNTARTQQINQLKEFGVTLTDI